MKNMKTNKGGSKNNNKEQLELKEKFFNKIKKQPEFGVVIVFVLITGFFTILNPAFIRLNNIAGFLTRGAELGIMAVGIAFLMIAGEFDLSVSSVYAFSGFLFIIIAAQIHSIPAFFLALVVAAFIGFINGNIVIRTKIPSFIATLGTMWAVRGLLLGITGGTSVSYTGDEFMPNILVRYFYRNFRPSHIWFIIIVICMSILLKKTRYGNWVFATGGQIEVARSLGVSVNKVKVINFILCAVLAGIAGIIAITRFRVASAAFGRMMELEAIASAVIGGTLMTGGYGTIIGAALGAVIMSMLRSGLVMVGAPSYWYNAFVGVILIVAAIVNLKLMKDIA